LFRQWLEAEDYHESTVELNLECVAAVVRFADNSLLPSRGVPERPLFADAATAGTVEFYLATEYFPVNAKIVSDETRRHYGFALAKFSQYLGYPATLADLNDKTVGGWVATMAQSPLTLRTVNGYIRDVCGFWKWAASRSMVKTVPTIGVLRQCDRSAPPERKVEPKPPRDVRRVQRGSPAHYKGEKDLGGPNSVLRFIARYLAAREVSAQYAYILRKIAAKMARFAGKATIEDLFSEDMVNDFLASLDLSPFTVRGYRSYILSLWNAAADDDLVAYPRLRRIRRPKCPEIVVNCYSAEEARKLLAASDRLQGEYPNGVTKRLYWRAAILLAWDTGLRRGDVWLFRKSIVRPDGTLRVVQHKTKQIVTVRLRESTSKAVAAIHYDQPLQWTMDQSYFGRHFRRILKAAGINRGSFKWLRRSSGSYVEIQQPGAGHKHLGQTCQQVFNKHYDGKLGGHTLPMPPDLDADSNEKGGAA